MVKPKAKKLSQNSRIKISAVILSAFSFAMWAAWLGWDHEYYLVDGYPQGPYRPWQVVGCALSIVLGTYIAYEFARYSKSLSVLPLAAIVGFAIPWSISAMGEDETGLWLVGLVLLIVGGGGGLAFILAVFSTCRKPSAPPPTPPEYTFRMKG